MRELGAKASGALRPGDVWALYGDLGAGKTVFVQGVAAALGAAEPVNSPTYTLVQTYRGRLTLHHVDLYRIENAEEAQGFGLETYWDGDAVTLIEWPERAEELLPAHTRRWHFKHGDREHLRLVTFECDLCD